MGRCPAPCSSRHALIVRVPITLCMRELQVKMDRFMGCVDNELATITGLELTVAPRRPAHMTHK